MTPAPAMRAPRCESTAVAGGGGNRWGRWWRDGHSRLRRGQHRTGPLHLFPELHQGNDARAVFLAAQEDPLPEDVHRDDLLGPRDVASIFPSLGKRLPRRDVELVLVLEAAEQPAAAAGDLRRVEREVLVLGERQADGRELREPGASSSTPGRSGRRRRAGPPRRARRSAGARCGCGTRAARSRTSARKSTRFSAVK